jgi:small GTP-binding protein
VGLEYVPAVRVKVGSMSLKMIKKNIIMLGDGAVGKTSLIRRFVIDDYSDDYIQTIGTKVTKKELKVGPKDDQREMVLMIWDIIGQKGYRYTQSLSFRGMNGALMVADLTRKETLDSVLSYWIPLVLRVAGPIPMIFLGNKSDLTEEKQFELEDIQHVAENCEAFGSSSHCYLTSAKTGDTVDKAFSQLAEITKDYKPKPKMDVSWNLMDREEVKSLQDVVDHIIADFSEQFGGIEHATPVIKHQMKVSELELQNPTEVSTLKFIDNLAKIEQGYKSEKVVNENRFKRLKLFGYKMKE